VAALDDRVRETVNRLLETLRDRFESELISSQEELVRLAQEETARYEAAARDAEELRAKAAAELEQLQRRVEESREEAQHRLEDIQRDLDDRQRLLEDSQKEAEAARDELDASRVEVDAARGELATVRAELESVRSELEAAQHQLDSTRDDVEATLREIETVRRDSDAAHGEVRRLNDALRDTDERVAQALRLPEALRALDKAATFSEVLETLAVRAGGEAGRAAVFLVKGERLRDWRTVGFERASDAPRLDLALGDSGPMAEAVSSGEGVPPVRGRSLPVFAGSSEDREAGAWPISVGGSVVAVLYADGSIADNSKEYWPAFLDVLSRHAGRVLEGLTVRQAAGLITRRAAPVAPSSVRHQSSGSIQ
jgi:hypothetical protein